jgi:protein-disulfide isomerase
MKRLLFAVVPAAALVFGCTNPKPSGTPGAETKAAATAEDPNAVVATVNGQNITLGELDKDIKGKLRSMEQEHREQVYKLREQGLEAMVVKRLMEAEAKKRGMSEEDVIKAEVESKVQEPTDAEAKAFFDQNSSRMPPGADFEQMKPRIKQFLMGQKQQQAMMAFFDKLKADAKVETKLEPPEAPAVEVAATGPAKGPANAPVTIVEFSDFQCPFCSRANATVDQVMKAYGDKVRLVFRDYPLPFHENAQKAAEASHCAEEQGKFWEMYDKLFSNQQALKVEDLKKYAGQLGLDQKKFDECLDSGKMAAAVKKNADDGAEAGVEGTPAFFINGHLISGAQPFEEFKRVIDKELTKAGVPVPAAPAPAPAAPGAPAPAPQGGAQK